MRLVLYSNRSLDELETITQSMFKDVENKDVVIPDLSHPKPYDHWNQGNLIKVVPVKEQH